jgi:hypothetical protein
MIESNIRFGVVNIVDRNRYEKTYHLPFGYLLTTFKENEAILHAKKMNNNNVIVEKIFDNQIAVNNKEEIYRSGKFKEGGNEKNN